VPGARASAADAHWRDAATIWWNVVECVCVLCLHKVDVIAAPLLTVLPPIGSTVEEGTLSDADGVVGRTHAPWNMRTNGPAPTPYNQLACNQAPAAQASSLPVVLCIQPHGDQPLPLGLTPTEHFTPQAVATSAHECNCNPNDVSSAHSSKGKRGLIL